MTVRRFLNYGRQQIDDADIEAVVEVLRSDLITQGPAVERFESALADRVGVAHAVAVSSGTAALHVSCLAAGVSQGDIGVTSALTFVASANAMIYCGASPMLTDIDAHALGMDPQSLEALVSAHPEISVVIPVHFAGLPHAAPKIREISGNRVVIEDASHSLGSTYECGSAAGSCKYSDLATMSFHPVKLITTAEGGAVVTNDPELAHRLRLFRNHGIEREKDRFVGMGNAESAAPWHYEQQVLGFNYRMSDLQAALGLSQLEKLDSFICRRREIAQRYDEVFSQISTISLPQARAGERARSSHHLYVAVFDFKKIGQSRLQFMDRLRSHGVGTQVHYIPVHRQPYHKEMFDYPETALANTEHHYRNCLSLPLHAGLTDEEVEYVIAVVSQALDA